MTLEHIKKRISSKFSDNISLKLLNNGEIVATVKNKKDVLELCIFLKNDVELKFDQAVDISGVDYLDYGKVSWDTTSSTDTGFSRGRSDIEESSLYKKDRFLVSYHLLSYTYNIRLRLHVLVDLKDMTIPSVVDVWSTANWHEREVYDFYGVIFTGHPNLERILTDYEFEDYPLRKDFPVTGKYEIRYDETRGKIIREPSFVNRGRLFKVIRKDFRYK